MFIVRINEGQFISHWIEPGSWIVVVVVWIEIESLIEQTGTILEIQDHHHCQKDWRSIHLSLHWHWFSHSIFAFTPFLHLLLCLLIGWIMESVIQEHVPYHQHLWSIHLSLNCCWEFVDIMTVFIFNHELFHWISIMEWYWRFRNNIIIIRIEGEFMCFIIGIGDLYFWEMDCVKCVFHFTGFHNNIGDSGACSLREMVEDNSTLTTLDLRVILWNMGDDVFLLDCFWEELYWFIRSVIIEIRIGGEFNNHINWIGMMFSDDVYFEIWRYLCLIMKLVDIQNQFHWDGYLKDCHNWHHWTWVCEFWTKCVWK